jgi:hypothetical protein
MKKNLQSSIFNLPPVSLIPVASCHRRRSKNLVTLSLLRACGGPDIYSASAYTCQISYVEAGVGLQHLQQAGFVYNNTGGPCQGPNKGLTEGREDFQDRGRQCSPAKASPRQGTCGSSFSVSSVAASVFPAASTGGGGGVRTESAMQSLAINARNI